MGKNAVTGDEGDDFGTIEGAHAGENSGGGALGGLDPARAAKVGSTRATVEAAMADLAGMMAAGPEPEQPELLLDDGAALFAGPVKHVAKTIEGARGRGRPRGSTNKSGFRDLLLRMGYRHPGLNLADIANASPVELALELCAAPPRPDDVTPEQHLKACGGASAAVLMSKAYDIIGKANAELMPYFESKRPTEIDVTERTLGVMVIGELPKAQAESATAAIDLTRQPKPE